MGGAFLVLNAIAFQKYFQAWLPFLELNPIHTIPTGLSGVLPPGPVIPLNEFPTARSMGKSAFRQAIAAILYQSHHTEN